MLDMLEVVEIILGFFFFLSTNSTMLFVKIGTLSPTKDRALYHPTSNCFCISFLFSGNIWSSQYLKHFPLSTGDFINHILRIQLFNL